MFRGRNERSLNDIILSPSGSPSPVPIELKSPTINQPKYFDNITPQGPIWNDSKLIPKPKLNVLRIKTNEDSTELDGYAIKSPGGSLKVVNPEEDQELMQQI